MEEEGRVVFHADEDGAVEEGEEEGEDVGFLREEVEWHEGVAGEPLFAVDEG